MKTLPQINNAHVLGFEVKHAQLTEGPVFDSHPHYPWSKMQHEAKYHKGLSKALTYLTRLAIHFLNAPGLKCRKVCKVDELTVA